MKIARKYRFYLDLPGIGSTQVYPIFDKLTFQHKYDQKIKAWRYHLDTELLFKNTDEHSTFDALYALEKQRNLCITVPISIDKYCNGGWNTHWEGFLNFRDAKEWNITSCQVELKPRIDDNFTCLVNEWKRPKNLFNIQDRHHISYLEGEIETRIVVDIDIVINNGIPDPNTLIINPPSGVAWRKNLVEWTTVYRLTQQAPFTEIIEMRSIAYFVREKWTGVGVPATTGWILEGADYYRPVPIATNATEEVISDVTENVEAAGVTAYRLRTLRKAFRYEIFNFEADNGITLNDAWVYLFGECGLTVRSDFFSLNAVGDAPDNQEYQKAQSELSDILLFQASDIILADAVNNATKFEVTLEDMWHDWSTKFNLFMFYDTVNSCMRIEHNSFGLARKMLNLTDNTDRFEIIRLNRKYTYIKEDFIHLETFNDKIDTGGRDFNEAYIEYSIECSNDDPDTNEQSYDMKSMITDIVSIYNNVDYQEDNGTLLSMVAIAVNSDGRILAGLGEITGQLIINYPLSWSDVITKYWLRDRPLKMGVMNGKTKMFLSTKPVRKQEGIAVKLNCVDIDAFRGYDRVMTQFGWGYIDDTVTIEDKTGEAAFLEFDLKFE